MSAQCLRAAAIIRGAYLNAPSGHLVLQLVRFGLDILPRHGSLRLGGIQIRLCLALAVVEVWALACALST